MKKVLLASSVLALSAGFASAEITFSGSAVMGVGDNGTETVSKLETYLTASASGETDAGLSFGFDTTMAVFSTDGNEDVAVSNDYIADDGTSVFISGAFGKLSMGSVAEADEVATLSDIGGIGGLGVDNVAESYTGDSAGRPSHDVNYTYAADAFMVAVSAHIGAAGEGDAYAVGAKYSFGDAYVGLGYNDESETGAAGTVTSVYAGGTFGAFGVKAMWSEWNPDGAAATEDAYGVYATYTVEALTLSAAYADGSAEADAAYGIGAEYDLGGGAAVVGGVANVDDETVWETGFSFSF